MTSDILLKYFPGLTPEQQAQFARLQELYTLWNSQINVISRKDIDLLYERHVLHSLGIARVMPFLPGENVLDVGTGGGFPGIPLAIMFPETNFHLVDSIGKKIKVVNEVAAALGLQNVKGTHARAEEIKQQFDFVVSRAVTQLKDFYPWVKGKFSKKSNNKLANGILYLKGGDLTQEIAEAGLAVQQYHLKDYFEEEFFETKQVIYVKG
ncbi:MULTISPECIES: 16S rRNA (guanine(527)-N(7))-methyltransferase RsmG [unclassified Mucilaginibacter]|uniref:16S rRNA (guanine(527)-N(7))-methyltransferase RsmG n=1 Tax=unclassified Mucilaginibacter TaxID=2617802 RepID=UPI002AC9E752|nr:MULTISPECIES: 16S rRNA (guanine(527)-N(7))-methyltransferase RsmG [unclassified Mucilaginibacter]MEB0249640.1 16S rRNA (guanine(527)-N(7))-methyltransferase RsmG [Mucilaginibacter sp. 5B2]MEB0261499.1 16S rRNA (guanine(527)-N(7))-methyltransferase RsmG [Mucilaginibacter sp. 10I4]MEB0277864.1 16S rRNA (guanine(527)-N(7))-methyltransferase RsmG [Mucilaginibacter sp. 10B2]MEB0300589.1 16S rRNA (guanine(527)-N(7))-methyltransferase RsmG [Mucilaginibacter sp. 5C4]WPX22756.1 16S rRNA (guanine(527